MDRTPAFYRELLGAAGLMDNASAIPAIYRVEDALADGRASAWMLRRLREHPAIAAMIRERYLRAEPVPLDRLRTLDQGTLGRAVASHVEDHGLVAGYYEAVAVRDDLTYVLARVRECHDVWHAVLGFAPTFVGETGQKAFEMAQLNRPMAGVVVATAILRYAVGHPEQQAALMAAVAEGYAMGLRAGPLLAERWEQAWDEPLVAVRERLNIPADGARHAGRDDPTGIHPAAEVRGGVGGATGGGPNGLSANLIEPKRSNVPA
ncbi:MAG: Coq4 family protein [Phycisphaerales bacterium]